VNPEVKKLAQELTEKLADQGQITEAGWIGFTLAVGLEDAPAVQRTEMRKAFFAGAMHIFTSMLCFLEAGEEPTDKDMKRMNALHTELEKFQKEFEAQVKQRN
jgi:hypothetical protein